VAGLRASAALYDPEKGKNIYEEYKDSTEQQLIDVQRKKLEDHDKQFAEIGKVVGKIKGGAENIATELDMHNKMMSRVVENFDKTRYKILDVEDNLDSSVASLDLCKLWTCIIVELCIVIMLLLT
jgi:hypothetical protein